MTTIAEAIAREHSAELIQNLSAELEEVNRVLALATMRIEELEAELDSATEQENPHG